MNPVEEALQFADDLWPKVEHVQGCPDPAKPCDRCRLIATRERLFTAARRWLEQAGRGHCKGCDGTLCHSSAADCKPGVDHAGYHPICPGLPAPERTEPQMIQAETGYFLIWCNDENKSCPGGNHYHNLGRKAQPQPERGEEELALDAICRELGSDTKRSQWAENALTIAKATVASLRAGPVAADNDNPWPTRDVLTKLADAGDHLLSDHECDKHGYEEVRRCVIRAREIVAAPSVADKGPSREHDAIPRIRVHAVGCHTSILGPCTCGPLIDTGDSNWWCRKCGWFPNAKDFPLGLPTSFVEHPCHQARRPTYESLLAHFKAQQLAQKMHNGSRQEYRAAREAARAALARCAREAGGGDE